MREKIQISKLEFGEAKKKWEVVRISSIFPVLNSATSGRLTVSKKTQGLGLNLSMHFVRD